VKQIDGKFSVFYVGIDGEKTVSSMETKKQIEQVKRLECALESEEGEALTWTTFDDPNEPRSLFQAILQDRKERVDQGVLMADRPCFAVVTAYGHRAIRLEYYEGHDELSLVYDIRAKELRGKELPKWLERDPYAYDPAAFLEEVLGIPKEASKPVLDAVHKLEKESVTNNDV